MHTNRDFEEKEIQMIKKINALKTHINILLNALPHKSAGIQGLKRTALKHKNKNCIKTTSLTRGIPSLIIDSIAPGGGGYTAQQSIEH